MPIGSMKSCSRISPGWMGGSRLAMEVSSVVVDDLDIGGLRALPAKTHAELVVDANAVLTLAVAAQCFKAVARRDTQVVEASRPVELFELRSEEHTSELQSLMRISYAVFCLKKKKKKRTGIEYTR